MKNNKQEIPKGFYDESNRIIAEFMGYKVFNNGTKCYSPKYDEGLEPMKFHKSWDWLMPVVESCFERLDARDNSADAIKRYLLVCDIERTYDEVVGFIMKYTNYTPNE